MNLLNFTSGGRVFRFYRSNFWFVVFVFRILVSGFGVGVVGFGSFLLVVITGGFFWIFGCGRIRKLEGSFFILEGAFRGYFRGVFFFFVVM